MRTAALTLIALTIAFPAAAQTTLSNEAQQLENRLWAQQQLQQQQALAAQRDAFAAQQQAQAAATIAQLRAQQAARQAESQAQQTGLAPLDPTIAAADEAMSKAQARILAESNARILQITRGSR